MPGADSTTLLAAPPNRWSQYGALSIVAGRLVPLRRPPVLVVSFPRCGSSWVGEVFGLAPDALYLREPLTGALLAPAERGVVFEVDDDHVPPPYAHAVRFVRAGVPAFPPAIARDARKWSLRARYRRPRLVVKEVNPLALAWFIRQLQPHVVFLVRHPAAVTLSVHEQGWAFAAFAEQFLPARQTELRTRTFPRTTWGATAALYAESTNVALSALHATGTRHEVVQYEALCADPVARFRELYAFAGLTWTDAVERAVRERASTSPDHGDAYSTTRDSARMADAWRSKIGDAELADVRAGWEACRGPLYGAETWAR